MATADSQGDFMEDEGQQLFNRSSSPGMGYECGWDNRKTGCIKGRETRALVKAVASSSQVGYVWQPNYGRKFLLRGMRSKYVRP